jgi:hypothetical protein
LLNNKWRIDLKSGPLKAFSFLAKNIRFCGINFWSTFQNWVGCFPLVSHCKILYFTYTVLRNFLAHFLKPPHRQ